MKTTFSEDLSNVLKFLESIDNIDCGGCGYAAYGVFLYMKKNYPQKEVKMYFCYTYKDGENIRINNEFLLGNNFNASACSHVVIKIDDVFYDHSGVISIMNYQTIHEVSEFMIKIALLNVDT